MFLDSFQFYCPNPLSCQWRMGGFGILWTAFGPFQPLIHPHRSHRCWDFCLQLISLGMGTWPGWANKIPSQGIWDCKWEKENFSLVMETIHVKCGANCNWFALNCYLKKEWRQSKGGDGEKNLGFLKCFRTWFQFAVSMYCISWTQWITSSSL